MTTSKLTIKEQVQQILHEQGFSKVYNETDFEYFKRQCRRAFNAPQAIADLFIQDNAETPSDYHDYVY